MHELMKLIDCYDIVSFDIFDTLIFRNISRPTDVFKTMNKDIEEKFNLKDFFDKRVECEMRARQKSATLEVTLDDIYREFSRYKLTKDKIEKIKKMEYQRELEFITVNPVMKKVFDTCIRKNKKVYLISDMYLDSGFIKKLLTKAGYDIKCPVYVSCECGVYKGNGGIFKYVCEKENLSYDKWLHIGDNVGSDVEAPRKLGMHSYHYRNVNSYEQNTSTTVFESIVLGMRNIRLYAEGDTYKDKDYFKRFGVKYLAPLYLGFTNFVYQLSKDCDNLFFLARDGYIIKKIYDLFPNHNNKYIDYLYVSRNSIQLPVVYSESKQRLMDLFTSFGCAIVDKTLGEFFDVCRIEQKEDYKNILNAYGFESYDDIITQETWYKAQKCASYLLKYSDGLYQSMIDNAKAYLRQEKVDQFDCINIVDIGWMGSIQDSISKLLDKPSRGIYFGTLPSDYEDYGTRSFAFTFDQGEPFEDRMTIHHNVMMFELIFSAPHPSALGYEVEKDGKVRVVFGKKDSYSQMVQDFQEDSFELIKDIMEYYKYYDNMTSKFSVDFYTNFIYKYELDDILQFKKLNNDIYLGNETKYNYVMSITKKELIDNQDKLVYELKDLRNCLWLGAFHVEGIKDYKEYVKLTSKLFVSRDMDRLNLLLDKYYETYDDYKRIVTDCFNKDYYKYYEKIAKRYYMKYHPSYIILLRRKIVPYPVRKFMKNLLGKISFNYDLYNKMN